MGAYKSAHPSSHPRFLQTLAPAPPSRFLTTSPRAQVSVALSRRVRGLLRAFLRSSLICAFLFVSPRGRVQRRRQGKMYTARKKIQKEKGVEPSEFEDSVAQVCTASTPCPSLFPSCHRCAHAFFDLENGNQELKSDLKDLYINNAIQMDVAGNRKAVVIHVPYRLRKAFRKIHVRLVRELEKKFSGKERNNTEYKLETFTAVYRRLCGKDVVFEYPVAESA
ncbi:hypothetical protein HU200_023102 [Digitaria exilis]|uniref:40S ribosomal protein S7 n=1 Tax=Digitaria exilis TaxID=1010633 RepID=A0A835C9D9_9POAL|nr:hypothetical protein HU200_023102 [Digitaria exilis]